MSENRYAIVTDSHGVKGMFSLNAYEQDEEIYVMLADGYEVLVSKSAISYAGETYLTSLVFDTLRIESMAVDAAVTHDENVEEISFPVVQEQAHINKYWRDVAQVQVIKHVLEREQQIEALLEREEIEIRRVPIDRVVETMPIARTEGDTMIIPVVEEVIVVEKRLVLKEEIHVQRRRAQTPHVEHVTVREQQVEVIRNPIVRQGDHDVHALEPLSS